MFEQMMENLDVRPENCGSIRDANAYAKYKGACGDTAEMWLRIDGGRIRKARFMTDGCAPSIACCSAAAKLVEGMNPERVKELSQQEVLEVAGAIPRVQPLEDTGGLFFDDTEGRIPDAIADDQALWIDTPEELVAVCGCCHSGLINTLAYILSIAGKGKHIRCFVGGFHLENASKITTNRGT